jgi:hypothetical protein
MNVGDNPFQFLLVAQAVVVRLALPKAASPAQELIASQGSVSIDGVLDALTRRVFIG